MIERNDTGGDWRVGNPAGASHYRIDARDGGWHWAVSNLLAFDNFALQARRLAAAADHVL